MPDQIERTIYRLEIDDSNYIKGVESLSASTQKFSKSQTEANERLKLNEAALKNQNEVLEKSRKSLENYTGTNERYRKQLEKDIVKAEQQQNKLTSVVDESRIAYEKATKAATDFNNISSRANNLQAQPGQRIQATPIQPVIPDLISNISPGELSQALGGVTDEFEQMRAAIALAEKELEGLNEESEEFKLLKPMVDEAKNALAQYDAAAEQSTESTQSLRSQLRQAREELVKLEQAGKAGTKQYQELELRTAKLTDAFNDQQQRIRVLASDTRLLNFGKAAIEGATAAFQAYTAVQILAGDESGELQKKTMQLFAAMQLLTSLQQLQNTLLRGSTIATELQSAAQAVYTTVVGTSTGALRAFRIALLATGIGAAIVAIGFLVAKYNQLAEATKEAERESKLLGEIQKETAKNAGAEIAQLEILYKVATNTTLSLKERKNAVNELQKQYPDYFKNIKDEIILQGGAADAYTATKLAILESAKARAIESKLGELATEELEADQDARNNLRDKEKNRLEKEKADKKDERDAEARGLDQFNAIQKKNELQQESDRIANRKKRISEDRQFLLDQIKTTGKPPPTPTVPKALENDFAKQKAALDKRLADLRRKEADGEIAIVKEFAKKRELEKAEIDRSKNLTAPQKEILKAELEEINGVELQKALETFRDKVTDERKKLNDELIELQQQNNQDTINLIQDEFERRAALIDLNEKQEIENAKRAAEERLAALELDKFLLGEKVYQEAKAKIVSEGEIRVNNIIAGANNERTDLAADIFSKSLETLENILDEQLLQLDETTAAKIQEQKDLLASGAINYEDFQKTLTKILSDQKKERDRLRLEELNTELAQINKRLETVTDAEEKAELQKRQRSARKAIAEINSQVPKDDEENKDVETVADYANAIGQLTESIISFWQKANEAEEAALDRSIALQEKRVEAAQRIAERGNATYLKQEQDRLNELQVKRENAARRDLAINAALQASQLLVGITGAIAKIATPGIGIAETIGAIGTIFAALATGYGLVKSLQGNQPRLAKGDKYVKRNGHPSGVDTIPAWLNEGEAVIPTDKNRAYHPTVSAIFDGTVPPEHLNRFVNTYHKIKSVPQVDYGRIKQASELHISSDGRMAVLLQEQNQLLRENNEKHDKTIRTLHKMGVNVSLDQHGFAVTQMEVIEQMQRDKKL